jgi:predicted nucleotidyltransferase
MGLLELVRKDREMRRIFGEQELKIIEKQLLGVQLSASEKTRLSRDIKPKFLIVENLSNYTKEFSLKKAQEIKFLIEEAKEIILEQKYRNLKKIYVFGSYTENKLRFDSDIDVALEFSSIELKEASKIKFELQGKVNKKIQINIFNTLPDKIKSEILNKGRVIYEYDKNRR